MKKIWIFLISIALSLFFLTGATTQNVVILSQQTQTILGATHERVQRQLSVSGTSVLQTYHYLGADFEEGAFAMITGDDYTSTGYRPATSKKHAENSQSLYDDYVIIGGVNADFFESYGVPQEAYIEDGQVISSGIGYANREVIGFKENGTVVFGKPVFEGYEVIIRDDQGRERIRLPLKNVNAAYVSSPIDIYAYFDTYNAELPSGVNKYIATATETKGAVPKIFGRGTVTTIRSQASLVVPDQSLVLVSRNVYLQNLLQVGDTMIIQRQMVGDFQGVRWAVGAYGKLVSNGTQVENIIGIDPTLRHPRSAIGVKEDGSVFVVAMDGRQTGYSQGATLYEMADLMLSYGAVTAYNFDGGGSTTMVLRDENDAFNVVNQPSDGTPRAVTNSIFLAVRINFDTMTPYPIPDYSTRLAQPTNLAINQGILTFDAVEGRTSYTISVNDDVYQTTTNRYDLKSVISTPGQYQIHVQAIGDGIFYRDSLISTPLAYTYQGPTALSAPHTFSITSSGVLSWNEDSAVTSYQFSVGTKVYTIFLNRFNLTTLNLEPGIYTFEIVAKGDGYNTADSVAATYTYRVYSAEEKVIKSSLSVILELLYQKNRD